jgi:hypothetical protein
VTLYATGLGPTTDDSDHMVGDFEVYLGDRSAAVLAARRVRGITGLYQIDVAAPALATDRLYLRAGGWQSNITRIAITPGNSVSNVTGSIDPLFPLNDQNGSGPVSFALTLSAGTFSTSMDIRSTADAFDIAAVGETGSAMITINPFVPCTDDQGFSSRGTYNTLVSTVTGAGMHGDFSGSIVPLWDYTTCDPHNWTCLAFPLSTIPEPRLPTDWIAALQLLPAPNVIFAPGPNAFIKGGGCLADLMRAGGSHLTISSAFGGFEQLALGYSKNRILSFALYVDGVKVASKDVSYSVAYRQ